MKAKDYIIIGGAVALFLYWKNKNSHANGGINSLDSLLSWNIHLGYSWLYLVVFGGNFDDMVNGSLSHDRLAAIN